MGKRVTLPSLYPHQQSFLNEIREAIVAEKLIIACAPPGTGKTRLAKWMLGSFSNRQPSETQSGHAVFAVHRRGLVDNASDSFAEDPALPHGLIMSGRETSGGMKVQVASIDTLISWFCEEGRYDSTLTYDFVVFDECHSHATKLKKFLLAHNKKRAELGLSNPFVLGLTATPQAKGLGDMYRLIVKGPTTEWLVKNGFLSQYRYFRATQGRLDALVRQGDDFTKDSVAKAMSGLSGDLFRDWKRLADGRPTVGFFPRLSHAWEAMELLKGHGLRCEYVDGTTSDEERHRIFEDLNNGKLDYLCNVGVVERGTDIPRIGCVQVCTAVGSIARWMQMIGRGSRTHPFKTDCIVIDHGGNLERGLGFFEDDIPWSLDWEQRPNKVHKARKTIECPKCQAVYRGGKCSQCGYQPTARERLAKGLKFDGSNLVEVKPKAKAKSRSPEQYVVSSLFIAGRRGLTFRQALAICFIKAKKAGDAFNIPSQFQVAGRSFRVIPYNHPDRDKKVASVYPFTIGNWNREGNRWMQ